MAHISVLLPCFKERKKVHNKEIFIMLFLYHKLTADYVTLMEKIAILTALRHISLGTF